MLPSSINATNWAGLVLVVAGGSTEAVLVCVVSVMAGLEMMSCAYSLVTRTAHSFLLFAIRQSYVFSAWSLEWRKAEASEALRASVVSLFRKDNNKAPRIRSHCCTFAF